MRSPSFITSKLKVFTCLILTLTVLTLISLLGADSSATTLAEPAPEPFRRAEVQSTFYHYYNKHLAHRQPSYQAYVDHLDDEFRLLTREVDNQLEIEIEVPTSYPAAEQAFGFNDKTVDFKLRDGQFFYNTVRQPQDCNNRLFSHHYNMSVDDLRPQLQLPLSASDYGRYYCFKVGLKVSLPGGFDLIPHRTFVVPQTVQSLGNGNASDNFPGFSRTIMQSTYYNYTSNRLQAHNHSSDRVAYYQHLNDHFNLYAQRLGPSFVLRISLPGHFAMPGRDINNFSLKQIEYTTVANKLDCDRPAFSGDVTRHPRSHTSISLTPGAAAAGRFYCVKVSIKGDRSWSKDVNPYRIFLIPQQITLMHAPQFY